MKHTAFTRAMLLALAMIMLISLAACGGGTGSSTATSAGQSGTPAIPSDMTAVTEATSANTTKSDDTVTVMLGAEPTALTGLTGINDQKSCVVMYALSARLFDFNYADGTAVPSLASGYEVIDDTHYRITLREDAQYSDGTPITAEDAAFCLKQYCDVGFDWTNHFVKDEIKAEDTHTLLLAYDTYVPGWDVGLCEATAGIYSQAAIEAVGGFEGSTRNMPLSGGRYNFKEWKPGEYMLLERNENYWDPDYTGYYKFIKILWASDSASRTLAVKSGDADVADTISVSECLTLKADPSANPVVFSTGTTFQLYFNCDKEPFNDPKLREAVSYLVDAVGINQLVNMGMGETVQGFIPRQMGEYYHDYFEGGIHPYDPEKGKAMLAEAGYGSGLTVDCIVLQANAAAATVVQEALRNAGITMNVTTLEPANYVPAARKGEYDITIGNNTNSYIAPDNFWLVDPVSAYNTIGGPKITDETMSEIVARANSVDHDTAVKGWNDTIDYLLDNHCLVGLYNKLVCAAINPDVAGLKLLKRDYLNITEMHPAA